MKHLDFAKEAEIHNSNYVLFPFYKKGVPFVSAGEDCVNCPRWGMTLLSAGSMRFRWNEKNPNRDAFFKEFENRFPGKKAIPLELIHSKTVYDAESPEDTLQRQGDGILSKNHSLIPVVTVADCVPVYFYDSENGAFGIVHSGWRGTGIAGELIGLMRRKYGSRPENILAAVGPHIHSCCYIVDKSRADYFADNFGSSCVREIEPEEDGTPRFSLSLLDANLNLLDSLNIPDENITVSDDCTACRRNQDGASVFGSYRRQGQGFTVQAAFLIS